MISNAIANTTSKGFLCPAKHSPLINKTMLSHPRNLKFSTQKNSISLKTQALVPGRSLYQVLEISEEVSFDEIKKAYKKLAKKYHPDVSPPHKTKEYNRRFIQVREAYKTLSDPNLKEIYDRDLARGSNLDFYDGRKIEEFNENFLWRNNLEEQMDGLEMRSTNNMNNPDKNSWAARMRRHRAKGPE